MKKKKKTFKIPDLSTILERKEEKNCFKKGNIFNINWIMNSGKQNPVLIIKTNTCKASLD